MKHFNVSESFFNVNTCFIGNTTVANVSFCSLSAVFNAKY